MLCAEQHVFRASPPIPSRAALRPADVITWFVPCTPPGGPVPTAVGVNGVPGCAVPASASLPLLKSSGRPSRTLECQSGRCLGDISSGTFISFPSRRTLLKVARLCSLPLGFSRHHPAEQISTSRVQSTVLGERMRNLNLERRHVCQGHSPGRTGANDRAAFYNLQMSLHPVLLHLTFMTVGHCQMTLHFTHQRQNGPENASLFYEPLRKKTLTTEL